MQECFSVLRRQTPPPSIFPCCIDTVSLCVFTISGFALLWCCDYISCFCSALWEGSASLQFHAPDMKKGCQRDLGGKTNIMVYMDAGTSMGPHIRVIERAITQKWSHLLTCISFLYCFCSVIPLSFLVRCYYKCMTSFKPASQCPCRLTPGLYFSNAFPVSISQPTFWPIIMLKWDSYTIIPSQRHKRLLLKVQSNLCHQCRGFPEVLTFTPSPPTKCNTEWSI